jgi:diacylglycerol kinase (ATP)
VNDQARDGEATSAAADSLRKLGLDVICASPGDAAAANDAIRQRRGKIAGVVVGGGDGSISAVLPAILELEISLGILPMGTANDFARTLGIPEDLQSACEVIASGKVRVVDVAEVNGHFFVNNAAIGLPCEMAADISHQAKGVLGPLASLLLLHRLARYARSFRARLIWNGRDESIKTNAILVGNGRYDGGFPVKYEAVDDGLLNVAVSTARGALETIHVVFNAWRRSAPHFERLVEFDTRELRVETERPHRISADGDVVATTPATFSIHRGVLQVFVG